MGRFKSRVTLSLIISWICVCDAFSSPLESNIASSWSDWSQWNSPAPITCMGPRDSLLWMSTKGGLARIPIYGGPATVYAKSNSGIPFDTLTTVDVSYEGDVLMGSPQGAIILGDGGRWTHYNSSDPPFKTGSAPPLVSGITRTKDGVLWIATRAVTLDFYGKKELDINNYADLREVDHRGIFEGAQGSIFANDGSGWHTVLTGRLTKKLTIESMQGIVSDPNGGVWSARLEWTQGPAVGIAIDKRSSGTLNMVETFTSDYPVVFPSPFPWISTLRTTELGLWASFSGDIPYGSFPISTDSRMGRAIVFIPKDSAKITVAIALSTPEQLHNGQDSARFGGPATVFSLDPAGNPWVLARDTLYGYDQTGTPFGTEILPSQLASKGPFQEMRIDKNGILFLRNESTVFWKTGSGSVSIPKPARAHGEMELLRGSRGLRLNRASAGPVRVEYLDMLGRTAQAFDMGFQPAGPMELPAYRMTGPGLLKVEAGATRRYFPMGPAAH